MTYRCSAVSTLWLWRGVLFLAWIAAVTVPPQATAQPSNNGCGPIANPYGPFDYRTQRNKLTIVERFHFQPHVEAVRRLPGKSVAALGGDMDYTLRASPNHHRALVAMVQYSERLKVPQVPGADYTVACYFDRAIRFAPDDMVVRLLFAGWLGRQGQRDKARSQVEYVSDQAGESPITLYNAGLVAFELGLHEHALKLAHRAQGMGWPRRELENQLRAAGRWEPPPEMPAAPSPGVPPVSTPAVAAPQAPSSSAGP